MRNCFSLAIGCALLGLVSGCTEPGDTTTIGAATGGAIGAGLGAIIGSQTGDAGAGLVIGAAAGAGTGALVGNALEGQDEKIRTQEEAITRQESTIAAQRRELDELRRMNDSRADGGSNKNFPSGYVAGASREPFRSSPYTAQNAQTYPARQEPFRSSSSATVSSAPSNNRPPANRVATAYTTTHGSSQDAGRSTESRGTLDWSATKDHSTPSQESTTLRERQVSVPPQVEMVKENPTNGALSEEPSDSEAAGTFGTTAKVAPATTECREAEQEVRKAHAASEAPDKLFHYRRALRLCPTDPSYHNAIGEIYLSLNRKVDAEFEFREALQIDPSYGLAQRNLDSLGQQGASSNTY